MKKIDRYFGILFALIFLGLSGCGSSQPPATFTEVKEAATCVVRHRQYLLARWCLDHPGEPFMSSPSRSAEDCPSRMSVWADFAAEYESDCEVFVDLATLRWVSP